jgi:hypothetical protein
VPLQLSWTRLREGGSEVSTGPGKWQHGPPVMGGGGAYAEVGTLDVDRLKMAAVSGLAHSSNINKDNFHSSLSLSLRAQEYLESLKKSSIVVVQILLLYLLINNLWGSRGWT